MDSEHLIVSDARRREHRPLDPLLRAIVAPLAQRLERARKELDLVSPVRKHMVDDLSFDDLSGRLTECA